MAVALLPLTFIGFVVFSGLRVARWPRRATRWRPDGWSPLAAQPVLTERTPNLRERPNRTVGSRVIARRTTGVCVAGE